MELKFEVEASESGKRLDLLLTLKQNLFSRSSVRKQMNYGIVKVNGAVEYRPSYKVKTGDVVEGAFQNETPLSKIIPEPIALDIIYEDRHLLVINKPAGLVVHPANGNWSGTLMNGILYHYQSLSKVGDNLRSGLIHRLDKDTSGLVLVGKTNESLWHYSKQFAERKVLKTYCAVVKGDMSKIMSGKTISISNFIARNPKFRKKFSGFDSVEKGKPAETEIEFKEGYKYNGQQYSLLHVYPKTGRTHQIRVHLQSMGFPILGDVIYGRQNQYKRLMLHAWKLKINMLDGVAKEFLAPLPPEFKQL